MDAVTVLLSEYPEYPARKVRRLAKQLVWLATKMEQAEDTGEVAVLKSIYNDLEASHMEVARKSYRTKPAEAR